MIDNFCGNLSKSTGGTLGSRLFLSASETLVWIPLMVEVTSLLLVEIVTGRGCLPQQMSMYINKTVKMPKTYHIEEMLTPEV